ncbi:MAG: type II toxin-antitoxin system VapC family toxin [Gammaproteobacteria bacterium]|nr:type II toxin-antitoxin system VapC family toxin [Gammaproteobacteria bacterium]
MSFHYLLDTNICIYIAKARPTSVLCRFESLATGTVGMSVITYGELCVGAQKSQHQEIALAKLNELADYIPVLMPDETVGVSYGKIRFLLERAGTPIGNNDLWIAAHALSLGLTLVTNNDREFKRIPELRTENWV